MRAIRKKKKDGAKVEVELDVDGADEVAHSMDEDEVWEAMKRSSKAGEGSRVGGEDFLESDEDFDLEDMGEDEDGDEFDIESDDEGLDVDDVDDNGEEKKGGDESEDSEEDDMISGLVDSEDGDDEEFEDVSASDSYSDTDKKPSKRKPNKLERLGAKAEKLGYKGGFFKSSSGGRNVSVNDLGRMFASFDDFQALIDKADAGYAQSDIDADEDKNVAVVAAGHSSGRKRKAGVKVRPAKQGQPNKRIKK